MTIMCAMTAIQVIRLTTYIWRLVVNKWATDTWMWYRVVTDWTNYLLCVIALVLLI